MELDYQLSNSLGMSLAGNQLAPNDISGQQFYYEYNTGTDTYIV